MKNTHLKLSVLLYVVLMVLGISNARGQAEVIVPPSNRSTATLEKNLLFYADARYTVSQQGSVSLPLAGLFDGNYQPNYSAIGIDESNPYVITIENLPNLHVQAASWIGWTTRYWGPAKFKIEVFNIYGNANTWVTIADVDNYYGGSYYMATVSDVAVGKIRFTVYKGGGPNNFLGISELFFIHPEATVAFDGLMVKYDHNGNVGIGTANTNGDKLAVKGNIHAQQVTVDMNNWADYVFMPTYELISLKAVKAYIDQNHRLPEMPSEQEVMKNGLNLGDMNKLLTKKIEELTLYLIEKDVQLKKVEEKQVEGLKVQSQMQEQLQKIQEQLNRSKNQKSKL